MRGWRQGAGLALLVVLSLAGCGVADERGKITLVKRTLKQALRDPESAQFRNVRVVRIAMGPGAVMSVCGEVNAKNGMGGYTGYRPFFAVVRSGINGATAFEPDRPDVKVVGEGDPTNGEIIDTFCTPA